MSHELVACQEHVTTVVSLGTESTSQCPKREERLPIGSDVAAQVLHILGTLKNCFQELESESGLEEDEIVSDLESVLGLGAES